MTMQILAVTRREYEQIMSQRAHEKAIAARLQKQKTCEHHWVYSGHSHNDDAYDCRLCGATEFR